MTGKPIVFAEKNLSGRFCPKLDIFKFLVWGSAQCGGPVQYWGPKTENHENLETGQNRRTSFLAQTLFVGARWDPETPRNLGQWPSDHLCAGSACFGCGVSKIRVLGCGGGFGPISGRLTLRKFEQIFFGRCHRPSEAARRRPMGSFLWENCRFSGAGAGAHIWISVNPGDRLKMGSDLGQNGHFLDQK